MIPAKKYPIPVELPEASKNGSFTIGASDWIKANHVNPDHSTAFDSVTVWDAALTADQVRSEYEKIVPPVKDKKTNKAVKCLKLKIKIADKYYSLKTNSKGIAKFNTDGLKVGWYRVVIFSDNIRYYVSCKSAIKVKNSPA